MQQPASPRDRSALSGCLAFGLAWPRSLFTAAAVRSFRGAPLGFSSQRCTHRLSRSSSPRRHPRPLRSRHPPLVSTAESASAPTPLVADPRGYPIPQPGQVVLYPGKWSDDRCVGLVEQVSFRPDLATWIVDVKPMAHIGPGNRYAVASRARVLWFEVSQVRLLTRATRDATSANWTVDEAAVVTAPRAAARRLRNPEQHAQSLQEYAQLKRQLRQWTALTGAAATAYAWLYAGQSAAAAVGCGAVSSLIYLLLLQQSVDSVPAAATAAATPRAGPVSALAVLWRRYGWRAVRLVVPVAGALALYAWQRDTWRPSLMLAFVLGFLSYKVPLLAMSARELYEAYQESRPNAGRGSGRARSYAPSATAASRAVPISSTTASAPVAPRYPVIVVAGPSGVGKSSLIGQLLRAFPDRLGYSVSSTTRPPRDGEVDGVSYHFLTREQFERDVSDGKFIEHAYIYGNHYGTSVDAVRAVIASDPPRACILSLDLQGVRAMQRQSSLRAFFVWIAPPSLEELERRLRERNTEDEETLQRRLQAARQEMRQAAEMSIFDVRVVNDDFERTVLKLKRIVEPLLPPAA